MPRPEGPRRATLAAYRGRSETLVIYESPRRIAATLALAGEVLGDRRACVARELTKLHEEVARGTLAELAEHFADEARGEFTLVIEGDSGEEAPAEARLDEAGVEDEIRRQLDAGRRPREIAAEMAAASGIPRRVVYARVLSIKEEP
jgi:16S rRNA (cytidine1402-2'-O)-methyltransferase